MIEKNKGNAKALQSQKYIEDALFKCMETKPYHKISIQGIADVSGVSRRTFYRNYETKDDIILNHFRLICKEYEGNLRATKDLSFPNIANIFFCTMQNHLRFLTLVNQHHLTELLIKEMDEFLLPLHQELRGIAYGYNAEISRIALTFSIGGFGRILVLWLNEGATMSPKELSARLEKALKLLQ